MKNSNGSSLPTIREIAKMAGVSIATVSHVVNGKGAVSDLTRQRVRLLIAKTGYVPNANARDLARSRNGKDEELHITRETVLRGVSHEPMATLANRKAVLR